jgi:hypothetical protein
LGVVDFDCIEVEGANYSGNGEENEYGFAVEVVHSISELCGSRWLSGPPPMRGCHSGRAHLAAPFSVPPPDSEGEGEPEGGEDDDVDGGADEELADAAESIHRFNPGVAEPVLRWGSFYCFALFEIQGNRAEAGEILEGFELGFGRLNFLTDVADVLLYFQDVADFAGGFEDFLVLGFFEPLLFESSGGVGDLGGDIVTGD